MLAGLPALEIYFDVGAVTLNYGGALPADLDGPPPPAGTPGYVVEWDDTTWIGDPNDTLRIWEVHADWTNPANSTFGVERDLRPELHDHDAPTSCRLLGSRDCVPQPGTAAEARRTSTTASCSASSTATLRAPEG